MIFERSIKTWGYNMSNSDLINERAKVAFEHELKFEKEKRNAARVDSFNSLMEYVHKQISKEIFDMYGGDFFYTDKNECYYAYAFNDEIEIQYQRHYQIDGEDFVITALLHDLNSPTNVKSISANVPRIYFNDVNNRTLAVSRVALTVQRLVESLLNPKSQSINTESDDDYFYNAQLTGLEEVTLRLMTIDSNCRYDERYKRLAISFLKGMRG